MMPKSPSISYDALADLLMKSVPQISEACNREIAYWTDENPGPHILYADILSPYICEKLRSISDAKQELSEIFEFLENLAADPNTEIGDVVALSVIDPLRNSLARDHWIDFLGPAMKKMLKELEQA